ncbi:MAG TPA: transcription antitermination factor NusB [Acidimicrobiales bacterium]|nr:transcription antitermination factor NusB [Acidimicrobiales bacterium]
MAVGSRREARERALGLLYEAESKELPPAAVLADLVIDPDDYVIDVVSGVGRHLVDIDALIGRFAIGWPTERMPAVDRNVLRLACFELLERPDVPTGVVLSEAVELATRFSTDDSGRFVNGVLAAIATEVRTA